jgi:hypothetical protein
MYTTTNVAKRGGSLSLSDWNAPLVVSILNNNIKSLAGSNTFLLLSFGGGIQRGIFCRGCAFSPTRNSFIYNIRHYK